MNKQFEGSSTRENLLWAATWIAVSTAFLLFWVLFIRSGHLSGAADYESLSELGITAFLLGIGIQELLGPLILLFLFSRTRLFQRVVAGNLRTGDLVWLILVLIAIHLVYMLFIAWGIQSESAQITDGLFVVLIAGVLGGWRAGIIIGLLSALSMGYVNYALWGEPDSFNLNEYLAWYVFQSIGSMAAIWFGAVAGVASEILRPLRRFSIAPVVAMGIVGMLVIAAAVFFTQNDSYYYVHTFLSSLILSVLGWIAFSMMARSVQDEQFRRQAESAQLELTEANLDLAQTRLALAQAELRALHAQINPHFFFNSLNTIRYFIRTDPDNARSLLTKLSEIFQRSLSAGEYVTLAEEIRHVEAYLSLEKARLEERLQIVWTHLAKEHQECLLPTLILQPLVENAVIHGISPKPEGGTIHIVINSIGGSLLIQVDDDGMGFDVDPPTQEMPTALANGAANPQEDVVRTGSGSSIGLANIRERLRRVYGDEAGLRLESQSGSGTKAILTIPLANQPDNQPDNQQDKQKTV